METGLLLAYIALGILATAPIYIGSWASIKFLKEKKRGKRSSTPDSDDETADDDQEYFSLEDAYMFPIFGSAALLTLYLVFKYLNKEYLNALFTAYFSILGVGAVSKSALDLTRYLTGWRIKGDYRVDLWKKQKEIATYHFGGFHFFVILLAIVIAGSYAFTKHWVLNNIYGEAFATSAIRLLNLDSFKTGIALLSFLFFYDIFWVFGTDVMVTVAKGFDAPIKVLWPKDIVGMLLHPSTFFKTEGLQFTLLGLGDIVIPGIFVALCLKFDHDRFLASPAGKKNKYARKFPKPYFTACSIAYVTGLVTTVVVMHNFQAAQPALLYLSPACIISVLLTGFLRGELKEVFAFEPGTSPTAAVKTVKTAATKTTRKVTRAASAALKAAAAAQNSDSDDDGDVRVKSEPGDDDDDGAAAAVKPVRTARSRSASPRTPRSARKKGTTPGAGGGTGGKGRRK